jgi:hypothetical protein
VSGQRRWTDTDRFAFATQRLRASTVPSRRAAGPTVDEWDDGCICQIAFTGMDPECDACADGNL